MISKIPINKTSQILLTRNSEFNKIKATNDPETVVGSPVKNKDLSSLEPLEYFSNIQQIQIVFASIIAYMVLIFCLGNDCLFN